VSKWAYREEGKRISKAVISEKSKEDLLNTKAFLEGLLGLRKLEKLYKTYINGTKKAIKYNEKDKIFVDYKLDGTTTGRLSCTSYNADKPMGVSFHTLPRDTESNIRSFFIAPKDHAFITVDYSAMELRVLSHISKEENMQLAFKRGEDLHSYTASLLFNKEQSKVSKEERQIAKTVSFLIVYGGGPFNLSETMAISLRRAEKIIDNYKRIYPGVFRFMDHINNFIKRRGYAYTIFGRRRNLQDYKSKDRSVVNRAYRQGLNFTIQSPSSDILLCSLLGINNTLKSKNMNSRIVSTVHDSIELIAPYQEVEELCSIVYEEMVNYPFMRNTFGIELNVPLNIETIVGKSFGDGVEVNYEEGRPSNISEVMNYLCVH
jgi:DNA polymerase-1